MYNDTARIAFATVEAWKSARRGVKGMENEAQYEGYCRVILCEYALIAVTILAGIVLLPALILNEKGHKNEWKRRDGYEGCLWCRD